MAAPGRDRAKPGGAVRPAPHPLERGSLPARFDPRPMVKARVELGLTQEEAARAIGVDVRTLRRYESGEVNARGFASNRSSRRAIVARIARELGVDESELLVEDGGPLAERSPEPRAELAGHALPRARVFAGRADLVSRIVSFLRGEGASRVLAVIGLGGAGKTALVARAVAASGGDSRLLIWSFYDEPRLGAFFEAVDARPRVDAIVLDGLEVLQADGRGGRARGEIEDARLRRLLRDAATLERSPRVLVTSRFELTGIEGVDGVDTLALGPLTELEAEEVLRGWGLSGDVARLARLSGGHALSTAMLGSYAKALFGGDAARVTSLDLADAARSDAFARRLTALLDGIASAVGPLERDVLACVAIFPRGVDARSLERLARHGDALADVLPALRGSRPGAIPRAMGALLRRGLVFAGSEGRVTTHPILREHYRARFGGDPRVVHDVERRALARDLEVTVGSIAERPASAPRDAGALDAYERLFEHTLWAGDLDGAAELLYRSLGGFSHLGLRLGAFDLGLRMARAFACEPGALPSALDAPHPRMLSTALAPRMRLRIAYEWGLYAAARGDLATALDAYTESNAVALELGDSEAFVTGLRAIAYTQRLRGDGDEARRAIDRSLRIALDADDTHALVRGLALSGAVFADAGEIVRAKGEFDRARSLGDRPFARRAIWEAEVHIAAGELGEARAILERTAIACAEIGWRGHEAHARAVLGKLRIAQGGLGATVDARADLATARAWADTTGEVEIRLLALELEAESARLEGEAATRARALAELREAAERGGFGAFLRRIG